MYEHFSLYRLVCAITAVTTTTNSLSYLLENEHYFDNAIFFRFNGVSYFLTLIMTFSIVLFNVRNLLILSMMLIYSS
jgi:hypothetical protein